MLPLFREIIVYVEICVINITALCEENEEFLMLHQVMSGVIIVIYKF